MNRSPSMYQKKQEHEKSSNNLSAVLRSPTNANQQHTLAGVGASARSISRIRRLAREESQQQSPLGHSPSLSIDRSRIMQEIIHEFDFSASVPILRRTRVSVFDDGGEEDEDWVKEWRAKKEATNAAIKAKQAASERFITTISSPSLMQQRRSSSSRRLSTTTQQLPSLSSSYDQSPLQQPITQTNSSPSSRGGNKVEDMFVQRKKTRSPTGKSPPKTPTNNNLYDNSKTRALSFLGDFAFEGLAEAVLISEEMSLLEAGEGDGTTITEEIALAALEKVQSELKGEYHKYFGPSAVLDFQRKIKRAAQDLDRYPRDHDVPEALKTPRSMYLRNVFKQRLLPLPLLMRKESDPLALNLSHRGLGDERMLPVINVLELLPGLRSLDLCDNRLTDITLTPLTNKLHLLHSLTHLDLSFNKIDDSSQTIMDYLRDPHCRLRNLLLNGADVDDHECGNLAQAIAQNISVKTLGLARNLIGQAELLNVVNPDLITGGEALGEMLLTNTTLTKLDLSWNSIRLESAVSLAKALEKNATLRTLILAYNSFGDMPSQVLGRSLKTNQALTELDIECNSITPKAATVLANAISFNEKLLKLNVNGNQLGRTGAQALVAAIQRSSSESRKLQVSFVNCDCTAEDHTVFSAANPHGTWRLNLREPYGQMVAAECLYLANFKVGCRIIRMFYNNQQITLERSYVAKDNEDNENEENIKKKFKIEEFYRASRLTANELLAGNYLEASRALDTLLKQFNFVMVDEQRMVVLKKTLELWTLKAKREGRDDFQEVILYEIFFALFILNDTDLSGTMELDEFLETLHSLGRTDVDHDRAKQLMSEYDRDESGSMDANEFGNIMLNEFCRTEIPRGELVDVATQRPFEIPPTGNLVIQLSYQCDAPTLYDIGADHGIDNIIQSIRNAKTDEQREILFQNTTASPYFFLSFEQAQLLFEEMQGLNRLPLELMASILPQIVNEEQAIKFIDTNLNDIGKFALRVKLGPLYGCFVGLSTGHYALDLRVAYQQSGGRRLGAISVTEGKNCRQAGCISSQKGNYSNFRNEKLGITNVDITGRWFAQASAKSELQKTLHFDYVSTTKPRKGTPPMTEARFEKLLQQLKLEEIRIVHDRIQQKEAEYLEWSQQQALGNSIEAVSTNNIRIVPSIVEEESSRPVTAAAEVTTVVAVIDDPPPVLVASPARKNNTRSSFLANLHRALDQENAILTRTNSYVSTAESVTPGPPTRVPSMIIPAKMIRSSSVLVSGAVLQTIAGYQVDLNDFPEVVTALEAPFTFLAAREVYQEYMETCHRHWDIYPEERMRDVSRPSYNPDERPPTPEAMKSPGPIPSKTIVTPIFPLAYRKILQLQILMPHMYLSIAQLSQLLRCFPVDDSFLRVLLIQSVFSHIIDLENMHVLFDTVLTVSERIELFHRVGILNVLDPMQPDRLYKLDLRRIDHREWVKILVQLAVTEPGDNWEDVDYRWGKYDDPVPGWTLPAPWTFADDGGNMGGPRTHGWLTVSYRSYGNGCMPVMSVRKYLRKRTLAGMKRII